MSENKKFLSLLKQNSLYIFFFIFCIYLATQTQGIFLSADNIINVTRQISINAILAVGMTFVIISGGIDLSVGSVVALIGVFVASIVTNEHSIVVFSHLPVFAKIFVGILLGGALGFSLGSFNGFMNTKFKIPPFISTLAMMGIARGIAFVYCQGKPISSLPDKFLSLGRGYVGPVPVPVIIMLLVVLVAYFILTQTKFGRYVYAIGGNEEAARLSGININKIKILIYSLSGFLSAISGVILAARLGTGDPKTGEMYELNAIAAVVLGGTSLMGGVGSVLGSFLGALIIGVLENGMDLLQISSYNQKIVKGVVILVAVLVDQLKKQDSKMI